MVVHEGTLNLRGGTLDPRDSCTLDQGVVHRIQGLGGTLDLRLEIVVHWTRGTVDIRSKGSILGVVHRTQELSGILDLRDSGT